ncbi:MAG: DUF5684 domain-containing protein [Candidatus Pacebacteria bacterium]|nr:DUF5684 domain-containing protein [Candidatus Paceibacterota bacterium]
MEEILSLLYFVIAIIIIASMWKVFTKAGRPGWEAIIPIYNLYIIQKLIKKPWWWILLMFIPWLGLIWTIWSTNLLAKSFGKTEGFTAGMILLPFVFYPILGFGNARYTEPQSNSHESILEAEIIEE